MNYPALVMALYEELGSYPAVAIACGDKPKRKGYYWNIAHGAMPSKRVKTAILKAARLHVSGSIGLTGSPRDLERGNVKIPIDLFNRMRAQKNARCETWEQWATQALMARMEE